MYQLINLLKSGLDGASLRQKTLAANIANLDTPGYKRRKLDFAAILRDRLKEGNGAEELSLQNTDREHLDGSGGNEGGPFRIRVEDRTSLRNDGNNVDIDREMAELARNTIYYNTLVNQVNARFRMLKDVISKASR